MRYSEYKKLEFEDDDPATYVVGEKKGVKFVSLSTLLLASKECVVKFNNDDNGEDDWEPVHPAAYFHRERKIWKIIVRRNGSENGFLEIWCEGKIKR